MWYPDQETAETGWAQHGGFLISDFAGGAGVHHVADDYTTSSEAVEAAAASLLEPLTVTRELALVVVRDPATAERVIDLEFIAEAIARSLEGVGTVAERIATNDVRAACARESVETVNHLSGATGYTFPDGSRGILDPAGRYHVGHHVPARCSCDPAVSGDRRECLARRCQCW